jgi:hypothetical protein
VELKHVKCNIICALNAILLLSEMFTILVKAVDDVCLQLDFITKLYGCAFCELKPIHHLFTTTVVSVF